MSEDTTKKQSQINLNTILMFIVIGVMGWMGNETVQNGKKLASIDAIAIERVASNIRVEKKVDSLTQDVFDIRLQLANIPGIRQNGNQKP